jgi:cytochrome c oxidase subunit II
MFIIRLGQRVARATAGAVPGLVISAPAFADYALTFQRPVTPIAHRILELHNLILLICFVIFVIVFGIMFYSVAMHRKSRGFKAARFHENLRLEIAWTVVPFVILIGMAIPSAATLLRMGDTSHADMTVKITGHQWRWEYEYPEQEITFLSSLATPQDQIDNKQPKDPNYLLEVDNPLVLPVGRKIRFQVTSADVIHSWWVPSLGVKRDAIPGFVNESWALIEEPGVYRGQCAELCGKGHGFMPIVVRAVTQEDFDKWVADQKSKSAALQVAATKTLGLDELMAYGHKTFSTICAACHGQGGQGVPGVFPALMGSSVLTGPLDQHLKTILHGRHTGKYPSQMPAFGAQLSDLDIAAVATFERNTFGRKNGELVQASQVKALR